MDFQKGLAYFETQFEIVQKCYLLNRTVVLLIATPPPPINVHRFIKFQFREL